MPDCGGSTNEYIENSDVRLIANAEQGYVFDHWSGDVYFVSGFPIYYAWALIDQDKTVTAHFKSDTQMISIRCCQLLLLKALIDADIITHRFGITET